MAGNICTASNPATLRAPDVTHLGAEEIEIIAWNLKGSIGSILPSNLTCGWIVHNVLELEGKSIFRKEHEETPLQSLSVFSVTEMKREKTVVPPLHDIFLPFLTSQLPNSEIDPTIS